MTIALHFRVAHFALPIFLLCASTDGKSEVLIVEQARTYTLDALQPRAFRKQLAQHLAQREPGAGSRTHGLTHADIEVQYRLAPQPGSECLLEAVRVTLTLALDTPRWEPVEKPNVAMQEGADATLRGLQEHGLRHRENAVRAAQNIDAALRALPRAPDCAQARRAAGLVVRQGRQRLRTEDLAHDQSNEFLNSARPTLGLASGTVNVSHLPVARGDKRKRLRVSVSELNTHGW